MIPNLKKNFFFGGGGGEGGEWLGEESGISDVTKNHNLKRNVIDFFLL